MQKLQLYQTFRNSRKNFHITQNIMISIASTNARFGRIRCGHYLKKKKKATCVVFVITLPNWTAKKKTPHFGFLLTRVNGLTITHTHTRTNNLLRLSRRDCNTRRNVAAKGTLKYTQSLKKLTLQ